jgi:hypothetical protein
MLGIEHRDLIDSKNGLCAFVQLYPVETAMLGIGIDPEDRAFVPAFPIAKFGIEENPYIVADADFFSHSFINGLVFQNPFIPCQSPEGHRDGVSDHRERRISF